MRKSSVSSFCTTPGRGGRSSMAGGRPHPSSSGRNRGRLSSLRLSGISMGRPSSAMVTALTGRPSYQESRAESKPQSDRSALQKNLKSLITFLTANQYPLPMNKLQSSPPAKDVNSIFEFLVSMLFNDFDLKNRKFEDTFPQVLTMLRYPHTISKRQLQPVGSMHNWPTIVAGFVWLCTSVKIRKCFVSTDSSATMMNQPSKAEIMMQFHLQPYNDYMDGNDDFDTIDNDFCCKVPLLLGMEDYKHLEELETEVISMEEMVNDIKNHNSELKERLSSYEIDYDKLQTFFEESRTYHSKLDHLIEFLQKETEHLESELASVAKEIQNNEVIIATQKTTPEEAQELCIVFKDLNEKVLRAKKTASKLNDEISAEEKDIAKTKNEVISTMERFNEIAESCQIIPMTAVNASNFDYEMKPSFLDSDDPPQFIEIECRLDVILKQFKSQTRDLRNKELDSIDGLKGLTELVTSVNGEIANTEAKIRREEEALEIARQEKALELQKLQVELDEKEKKITKIQFKLKVGRNMEIIQSNINELTKRSEELEQSCVEKTKEQKLFMMKAYEKALLHKRRIEERVEKFAAVTESVLKVTKEKCCIHVKMNRLEGSLKDLDKKVATLDRNSLF